MKYEGIMYLKARCCSITQRQGFWPVGKEGMVSFTKAFFEMVFGAVGFESGRCMNYPKLVRQIHPVSNVLKARVIMQGL
jgi:hypothetical protein